MPTDIDFNPADAFRDFYRTVAAVEPEPGSQLDEVLETWAPAYEQVAPRGRCSNKGHGTAGLHAEDDTCIDFRVDFRAHIGPGKHRGDVVLYIDAHDTPRCATCSSTNVGAVDRGSEHYSLNGIEDGTLFLKSQNVDMKLEFICFEHTDCPPMGIPDRLDMHF